MDSGKPTLGYWKMRGFGQQIRHLLAYCKVDYEQTLFDQGPAPDFVEDEWQSVKQSYGFEFPNLPFFIDGDFKMTETQPIMKYIALKWKPELMLMDDPKAFAVCEMFLPNVRNCNFAVRGPLFNPKTDLEAYKPTVAPAMKQMADWLKDKTWITGDKISIADFEFAEIVEAANMITSGEIFVAHPHLKTYVENFRALPGIKEFIETNEAANFRFHKKQCLMGGCI